ncbi:hypothetical protein SKTS_20520 [Sulfurimicrobium lacus]|uniref:HD-GYP domain-containing protein n=1 Tax=Sulfurimicrobium lacus TaxID=2715678 RepID=A0A6F8VDS3_9PROT|nr:HD domain-containing phosphohydrolase [Sulfurimicrobium lacus]BCB27166.1 hypothetical protein SKTS_20520 [Sulfurimicrobium lacus]
MRSQFNVSLYQFVFSLSQALDLINPTMANHHKRVAYIAMRVAEAAGLTGRTKEDVIVAAALHDIGGLSVTCVDSGSAYSPKLRSARIGYQLLQKFHPFQFAAQIVRFHDIDWANGANRTVEGQEVPLGSHIVHLANRVNTLLESGQPTLPQAKRVCAQLAEMRGSVVVPELLDAFLVVARSDAFWLDLNAAELLSLLAERAPFSSVELNREGLLDFAELLAQLIDFRSRFTATHSSGVAACAAALAQLFGFPDSDCKQLQVAGYLHDLGKLAVPTELLERNGKLSEDEWHTIRGHPYFTHRILSPIKGLEDIARWCGSHHERPSGTGYPFCLHHVDLPLEARILAVADIFTALTENRPYRDGLQKEQVMLILDRMVENNEMDRKVVAVLREHYEDVDHSRFAAQTTALQEYKDFMQRLTVLDLSGARAAHLAWKDRLRDYLDGRGAPMREQLVCHRECDLGRWFYSDGLHHYDHIPEMHELEPLHAALHQFIRALVENREQGKLWEAEACFSEVDPLSRQIVDLLERIERKASEGVADSLPGIIPLTVRPSCSPAR